MVKLEREFPSINKESKSLKKNEHKIQFVPKKKLKKTILIKEEKKEEESSISSPKEVKRV